MTTSILARLEENIHKAVFCIHLLSGGKDECEVCEAFRLARKEIARLSDQKFHKECVEGLHFPWINNSDYPTCEEWVIKQIIGKKEDST